jgi:hypothetical protein
MVLLDVRFHYDKQGDKDRLGDEQWEWLEAVLRLN